eukprot:1039780-Rhodomonas_salina.1
MPQVYDLTLPEDFEGGVKSWEAYYGIIISTLMDERLSIIVDIVSAVVTACQKSVGTPFVFSAAPPPAPPAVSPEGAEAAAVSAARTARIQCEARRLNADLSSVDMEGTGSRSSDAGAPQRSDGQPAAADPAAQPAPGAILLPNMLLDPAYNAIFEYILRHSPADDLIECMKWECLSLLADHHKDYNDKAKMQVADDAELASLHENTCCQISHQIACQAHCALHKAFIKKSVSTPEQDAMMHILCTKFMTEVGIGKHYKAVWVGPLFFNNPAVVLYTQIKYYFESVTETSNVNLAAELIAALQTQLDANINEVVQKFEKVINPIAQTYTTVPTFVEHVKASLQYE